MADFTPITEIRAMLESGTTQTARTNIGLGNVDDTTDPLKPISDPTKAVTDAITARQWAEVADDSIMSSANPTAWPDSVISIMLVTSGGIAAGYPQDRGTVILDKRSQSASTLIGYMVRTFNVYASNDVYTQTNSGFGWNAWEKSIQSDAGVISDALTFSGQQELTGQLLTTADSAVNRALGDARYSPNESNIVLITQVSDFGTIDSTKFYKVIGDVDTGSTTTIIPEGVTLNLISSGYHGNSLFSTANNYTMFESAGAGCGAINVTQLEFTTSGTLSRVWNCTNQSGLDAFENIFVRYVNCTARGYLKGFVQGLMHVTSYRGGTPTLELDGTWLGGWLVTVGLTTGITNGSYSLYKAGATFLMNGRYKTDMNMDLKTDVSLFDFAPSNFPNSSTVQLNGVSISRNGVLSTDDSTVLPNMSHSDLVSMFSGNSGITNTHVGATDTLSTEVETTIASSSTFVTLAGTWTTSDLQHFDSPSNGQLRHLGVTPREFKIRVDLILVGGANDEVEINIRKWDDSASAFVDEKSQVRQINALQGGRNVALFSLSVPSVTMDENDYIFIQVANNSNTTNVTAEIDSSIDIEAR